MEHFLIRATVIPEIVRLISLELNVMEDAALDSFYRSRTAAAYANDETGLYGQSALFIYGMYLQEKGITI